MSIEKKIFYFCCQDCNNSDDIAVIDRGNPYSGSCWPINIMSNKFDIIWDGGGKDDPTPKYIKCNCCGSINVTYITDSTF